MRHNSREYAGVSLDIPIFNRRAARNDISKAQLAVRSQQLAVTQTVQAKYEFVFRRRFPISTAGSRCIIFLRKMAAYSCFWRGPRSKNLLQASLHRI